ncbi:hypothetical protein [Sulfitobacter donghicola]|uniref:DUF4177 domain-containing protein n=1 Tax=Sulfitobacter donghicola DSW-25 = KCTC 12864 = JCM 14565 TaxID=1300350 RepID=A0A073IIH3_9RHOB|nr:hypothetical protein [Sulfitobacter donghicola]KEJ89375.1 hypothetical protein DSW25_10210 [Sulfitobacter donghicola DSW-25 = KCTC 12864 = JCM 14565]KIN69190.1 hypothetical protein Z948_2929 [Sulfitobacter donghicola DSW-25 = KCTC 12864 = JCM 14565]
MIRYEYKVVPAPTKGIKGKGVRGAEAKFSFALQELMNGMSGYGWEYQRSETLPSVERSGIAGTTTEWRNVLVFRRPRSGDAAEFQPELLPAPSMPTQEADEAFEMANEQQAAGALPLADNGVEDTEFDANIGASLSILARARNVSSETTGEDDADGPMDDEEAPKD